MVWKRLSESRKTSLRRVGRTGHAVCDPGGGGAICTYVGGRERCQRLNS